MTDSISTIQKALDSVEIYEKQNELTSVLYSGVDKITGEICFEEFKNCDYKKTNEVLNKLFFHFSDEKRKELFALIKEKKEKEYPEILGVHYYPELKELNTPEDYKIKLDRFLRKNSGNHYRYKHNIISEMLSKHEGVIDFLIEKKIIEKQYILGCTCDNNCSEEAFSQTMLDDYIEYWRKEMNEGTTIEEDEKFQNGFLCVGCWADGQVEICDYDEFMKSVKYVAFKIIKKPDLTLEEL